MSYLEFCANILQTVCCPTRTECARRCCCCCGDPDRVEKPGAPRNLVVSVGGGSSLVSLAWSPPASGGYTRGYLIQAGSSPGESNAFAGSVDETIKYTTQYQPVIAQAPATSFSINVATGTFFVRVLAQNDVGISEPSNEVTATLDGTYRHIVHDERDATILCSGREFHGKVRKTDRAVFKDPSRNGKYFSIGECGAFMSVDGDSYIGEFEAKSWHRARAEGHGVYKNRAITCSGLWDNGEPYCTVTRFANGDVAYSCVGTKSPRKVITATEHRDGTCTLSEFDEPVDLADRGSKLYMVHMFNGRKESSLNAEVR